MIECRNNAKEWQTRRNTVRSSTTGQMCISLFCHPKRNALTLHAREANLYCGKYQLYLVLSEHLVFDKCA